jgi:hypothetical protein
VNLATFEFDGLPTDRESEAHACPVASVLSEREDEFVGLSRRKTPAFVPDLDPCSTKPSA